MQSTYFLSVFQPLTTPGPAHHVVTVYRVETAASLEWVRKHADELALLEHGPYDALMVSETTPT